jgi:hypothetical protein
MFAPERVLPQPYLEEVFKLSGVPTYTFVKPAEYSTLLVALRTPGRGVVIEGPSGIGKTSAVARALEELGLAPAALRLSARRADDIELIRELPTIRGAGTVIVDDFHRLPADIRQALADYIKVLADEERHDVKLVVIGINRAGDALIRFAPDLNARIETIAFEANPDEKVRELVELGERALNVSIATRDEIVAAAAGGFYLAQYLSHHSCLHADVLEAQLGHRVIASSFEVVRQRVMEDLARRFMEPALTFACGTRFRREGRAPYLHILRWLSEAQEWSIQLDRQISLHSELRGSVGQVVEKGYLKELIETKPGLGDIFHYDNDNHILAIEDPQFVFFLRNLLWNKFAERAGFINVRFDRRYDFALSFAGTDRPYAERLFQLLEDRQFEVFYDRNEQHRILAENVEDYLGPIYRSEAAYVVCLLGPDYPKRIWTKFESDQFKSRFGQGSVIPVWFTTAPPGVFDESARVGGYTFDPAGDVEAQLEQLAETLARKLSERMVANGNHRAS